MAFSNDFRKRIIDAYKKDGLSKAEIIRRFKISRTGLNYLLQHVKDTKSIEPKPHGGGRPSKFKEQDIERLKKYIAKNPDATLEELLAQSGIEASIMAVQRTLKKIGYRLKKSHYAPASKNGKRSAST